MTSARSIGRAARANLPLLLILLLAGSLRALYIDAPLLDAHRWRQVDTAFIARAFYQGHINPFKPEANWGGAHGYVESEFPLLPTIVAVLYRVFGPDETWGRVVVALFSVGVVALTGRLARRLLGDAAGLAAAMLMAVSPSAVFYGRAFMPDTLMLFFMLGAVIGFLDHARTGSRRRLVLGSISLALAILVKLPGVLAIAPVGWIAWSRGTMRTDTTTQPSKDGLRSFARDRALLAALVLPLVVGAAWYAYAYSIYLQTGLTYGIIGTTKTYLPDVGPGPWPTAFSKWSSFGLLTSGRFYDTLFTRLYFLHLTPPGFVLSVVGLLVMRKPERSIADAWLLAALAFVFAAGEGQMGHDYYQLPLVPICAIYFAAAARPVFDAGWIAQTVRAGRAGGLLVAGTITILGVLCFWQSGVIDGHFRPGSLDTRLWRAGQQIDGVTDDNSLMVVVDDYGVNSPMLLYFAHARGWSLDADTATAQVVDTLRATKGARYFATTRLPEIRRRQPDLALLLDSRRAIPLSGAPAGTALFDLTAPR